MKNVISKFLNITFQCCCALMLIIKYGLMTISSLLIPISFLATIISGIGCLNMYSTVSAVPGFQLFLIIFLSSCFVFYICDSFIPDIYEVSDYFN